MLTEQEAVERAWTVVRSTDIAVTGLESVRKVQTALMPPSIEALGDIWAVSFARPTVGTRVVVVGNAAQALHPVAGQGFNLGLRDAHELAEAIVDTPREALGGHAMLAAYARRRRPDRAASVALTDGLVRIFGNDAALLRWPRGIALALLDALPPAKRAFTRAMMFGPR